MSRTSRPRAELSWSATVEMMTAVVSKRFLVCLVEHNNLLISYLMYETVHFNDGLLFRKTMNVIAKSFKSCSVFNGDKQDFLSHIF